MVQALTVSNSYFVTELLGTDLHRLLTSRPLEKQFIQYFLYQILVFLPEWLWHGNALTEITAWPEICAFSRSCTSWSEAQQHSCQRELRLEDLRFRTCSSPGSPDDRLCLDEILQSARNHAYMAKIRCRGWYLECRLHLRRNAGWKAFIPRQGSRTSILNHHRAARYTARWCYPHYC